MKRCQVDHCDVMIDPDKMLCRNCTTAVWVLANYWTLPRLKVKQARYERWLSRMEFALLGYDKVGAQREACKL